MPLLPGQENLLQTGGPGQAPRVTDSADSFPTRKPHYPLAAVLAALELVQQLVPLARWGDLDEKGVQKKSPVRKNWQKQRPGFTPLKEHVDQDGLLGLVPYLFVVLDVDQGDASRLMAMFPPYFVTASRRPGGQHVWYPCPPGYKPPSYRWQGPDGSAGEAITGPGAYVVLWRNALQELVEQLRYGGGGHQAADFRDVAQALTWLDYLGRPADGFRPIPDAPALAEALPGSRNTALFTHCLGWGYDHHQDYADFPAFQNKLEDVGLAGWRVMDEAENTGPTLDGGDSFSPEEAEKVARSAARRVWAKRRVAQDSLDYPPSENSRISSLSAADSPDPGRNRPVSRNLRRWFEMGYRGDPALNVDPEEQRRRRNCRTALDQERVTGRQKHVAIRVAAGHPRTTVATAFGVSDRTIQRDVVAIEDWPSKRQAKRKLQADEARRRRAATAGTGSKQRSGSVPGHSPAGVLNVGRAEVSSSEEGTGQALSGSGLSPPGSGVFSRADAASSPPRVYGLVSPFSFRPVRDGPPWPEQPRAGPLRAWVCRGCGYVADDLQAVGGHLDSFPVGDRDTHLGWDVAFQPATGGNDAMDATDTAREALVSRSTLVYRQGWTDELVERYLGEPDYPDQDLYQVARVQEALQFDDRLGSEIDDRLLQQELEDLGKARGRAARQQPRVFTVAWCPDCELFNPDSAPGQPCTTGAAECGRTYVAGRGMLCQIRPCCEDATLILITGGRSAQESWQTHLQEDHTAG